MMATAGHASKPLGYRWTLTGATAFHLRLDSERGADVAVRGLRGVPVDINRCFI